MNFTAIESSVLKRAQEDIPLVRDPFAPMAQDAGVTEQEFMAVLAGMKESGVIRNIAGIFSAAALGYHSALVAFRVPPEFVERAAAAINGHPGVSHNYLRDHDYNIWFTLAVERDDQFVKTVGVLAGLSGAIDSIILNNEKMFKLGVAFSVDDENDSTTVQTGERSADAGKLSAPEREAVRLLQADLPVCDEPFAKIISERESDLTEHEFLQLGQSLKERGVLRRYSAVLRHRKAGYTANAMTVWKPSGAAELERAAGIFARERAVSHLYARTVYPGRWEYPLFAMIHARSDSELEEIIRRCALETGIVDYHILHSVRELKKERVAYFSQKFTEWNTRENI